MLPFDTESEFVVILGYDGTAPAQRALEQVAQVMRRQTGWLQVVTVTTNGGGVDSADLAQRVQRSMVGTSADWRFESRHGVPGDELLSCAREVASRKRHHPVAIAVGSPRSHHPDLNESILAVLLRSSPYPILVVP
jgi:hypothetical protein